MKQLHDLLAVPDGLVLVGSILKIGQHFFFTSHNTVYGPPFLADNSRYLEELVFFLIVLKAMLMSDSSLES